MHEQALQIYIKMSIIAGDSPGGLAQLDRVAGFEPVGQGFESLTLRDNSPLYSNPNPQTPYLKISFFQVRRFFRQTQESKKAI